jgi:NAD(P)-dependent dehydrogenase (short-subunit alcohol dehydrogenase family)
MSNTNMRLQNKTALITGGNSGIGLATARRFIAEGANVVITGRKQPTLDAAVAELGERVLAVKADVTDVPSIERAIAQTIERFGALNILFANAGIGGATPLGKTTAAMFAGIVHTNLIGTFFTVQSAVPHLKPGASIILNGSVHAEIGYPAFSAYAASKAGIRAMARVMASELAPRGIRVNVVVPGAVRTPIWNPIAPTPEAFADLEQTLSKRIPLGHLADPEQIASMAAYLASEESAYINGAEMVIDGGLTGSPSGAPIFRG